MSRSFIQPFYTTERKTCDNLFATFALDSIGSVIVEADKSIFKLRQAKRKAPKDHPFWNCITSLDDSNIVFCYGDTIRTFNTADTQQVYSCSVKDSLLVDIEGNIENSKFVLVRSQKGRIYLVSTNKDDGQIRLAEACTIKSDVSAQMALDGAGSFFCVGDSKRLSVYDLNDTQNAIFTLNRQSAGPVAFAPCSQPNVIYQGCRTYAGVIDLRESREVSRIIPNPAQITLSSYSTLLKYSCLSVNPVRDFEIALFSQQHHAVQIFDTRHVRSPVWEWALPGREHRTEDRLPPLPIRHMEYSFDGSELLINRPLSFSSYVISTQNIDTVSPFVEIPTCADFDSQIANINDIRNSTCASRHPPTRAQKPGRELNGMKFTKSSIAGIPIEFSLGACFHRSSEKSSVLSITSLGKMFPVTPKESSAPIKSSASHSLAPTLAVPQIVPEVESVSPDQVDQMLIRLNKRYRPRARYPRLIRSLSNRDKFFIFCVTRIIPHLPRCTHHRGAEKSVPGSFVWNLCVDKCGFRRPANPPVDPVGTVHVTTIREIQIAYSEMYGQLIHGESIFDFLQEIFRKPKKYIPNPNIDVQFFPTSPTTTLNPLLFDSTDSPAVIVIVKKSRFAMTCRQTEQPRISKPPIVNPDDQKSSSSSDDDDMFSQKRQRTEKFVESSFQKTSKSILTNLTPLAGDLLHNRYITTELVDQLRAKWVAPKFTVKRDKAKKPKAETILSLEKKEETSDEEEEELPVSMPNTPELFIPASTRLSELLRGASQKTR